MRASGPLGVTSYDEGDRTAWVVLAIHASIVLFGTLAMVTILAGDFPVFLQGPYTAEVFRWSWKFTGPAYVVLGCLAALVHSAPRIGTTRALTLFAAASVVALAGELAGTTFGLPFGPYHYTDMLGYKLGGHVPFPIPISWYYMLYGSLAMCGRLLSADDSNATRWRWAFVAGAILTAWDVPQDPAMTAVSPVHWVWDFASFPAWVPAWLKAGLFYGMPISNWIGWLITGSLVARVMLAIIPPTTWRDAVAPSSLPLVLYALNGVMPIAMCARHGMWWAVILGVALMGLPVWLSVRAGAAHAGSRSPTGGTAALEVSGG